MHQSTDRTCAKCGETKPLTEYTLIYKNDTKRDRRCKECVRAVQRANPNNRRRALAWSKQQHADKTEWAKARIKKESIRGSRRQAAMKAEDADPIKRDEIFARDGFTCQLCSGALHMAETRPHPKSPSIDHIVPLSRGGAHTYDNVQATHLRCNESKNAQLPENLESLETSNA